MMTHRYHVTVALHGEPDPIHEALALSQAFSTGMTAVMPDSLTGHADTYDVEVGFDHLDDGVDLAVTPDRDRVLGQLSGQLVDHSVLIPALKALVAVDEAARRAGLKTQERLSVEVEPERAPPQRWDELEEL